MGMGSLLGAMLAVLTLTGCQATVPNAKPGLDNSSFMNLWTTYRHCETGIDVDTMFLDAQRLNAIAQQSNQVTDDGVPLPRVITRLMSEPANRLAVDPKAMAVSCSLRTGQTALVAGRYDLASEMFQAVLSYPEGAYPYHADQARAGLAQVNSEAELSGMSITAPSAILAANASGK